MSQRNFKMPNPNNESHSYFLRNIPEELQPQFTRGFNQWMGNQSTMTKGLPSNTVNKSAQTASVNDGNLQASVIAMLAGMDSILDMEQPNRSPSREEHERLNELLFSSNLLMLDVKKRTFPVEDPTGYLTSVSEQNPDGNPLAKRLKLERPQG
uniref:Jean-baptiste n=2 Tax=Drosophila melanogaster TaxID=7227 RepID=Q9VR88_DROME|eukprot:NP_001097034.2 jean-baptiste [Drosophila melanogaster]